MLNLNRCLKLIICQMFAIFQAPLSRACKYSFVWELYLSYHDMTHTIRKETSEGFRYHKSMMNHNQEWTASPCSSQKNICYHILGIIVVNFCYERSTSCYDNRPGSLGPNFRDTGYKCFICDRTEGVCSRFKWQ